MKILVENSTWNNIGDGWYQFSIYYLLKTLCPEHNVVLGEGPINRAFRIKKDYLFENALNLMEYQTADLHVFSGPMIPSIIDHYGPTIKKIINRGSKYCIVSASGTGITESKSREIGEFISKYSPSFVTTRDEETFIWMKNYVRNIYNGICTAFLVGRTIKPMRFEMEKPFFVSSFYTELEPFFSLPKDKPCTIENIELKHNPTMLGLPFWLSRHLNFKRKQQVEVGDMFIVRTIQNLNTRFNHINFAMPNSFISFNPMSYLEVVNSSEFTISDRVHACAVSLALNKPARFLFNTPRAGIFDRMGFDYKANKGIMYPNMDKIDEEKYKLEKEILTFIAG